VRLPPVREASAPAPRRVPATLLQSIERSVIHEDEQLLVLDKPSGVAVHGGSGLSFGVIEALRASRPDQTLELAHRLDRDTSGVLLVAKRASALRELHALLRDGAVQKSYLVLVAGRWQLGIRASMRRCARTCVWGVSARSKSTRMAKRRLPSSN